MDQRCANATAAARSRPDSGPPMFGRAHGQSHRQIAEQLGISAQRVRRCSRWTPRHPAPSARSWPTWAPARHQVAVDAPAGARAGAAARRPVRSVEQRCVTGSAASAAVGEASLKPSKAVATQKPTSLLLTRRKQHSL